MLSTRRFLALTLPTALVLAAGTATAQPVPATLVVKAGDVPTGSGGFPVSSVNTPFTTANGKVGFSGNLTGPSGTIAYIWFDTGIVWRNDLADPGFVLSGAESTMGIGDNGEFLYSPSVNTNDAAWSHQGLVLMRGDPAPDVPGFFATFNSRPQMTSTGTGYWVAGLTVNQGSSTTQRRIFYTVSPTGVISRLLEDGDVLAGFTIANNGGINFNFWVSENDAHRIHQIGTTEPAGSANFIFVNGAPVARQGTATGDPLGDNWNAFNAPGINNSGNYIFTASTSPAGSSDQVLAYNGCVVARELDVIAGYTLPSGGTARAAAISNLNNVAYIFGSGSGATVNEALIFGYGPTFRTRSAVLARTGDEIDVTGDMIADFVVADFTASTVVGPGLDIQDNGIVYADVALQPIGGGANQAAIVGFVVPVGLRCPADWDQSGSVNSGDVTAFLGDWFSSLATGGRAADFDGSCATNSGDVTAFLAAWFAALAGGC